MSSIISTDRFGSVLWENNRTIRYSGILYKSGPTDNLLFAFGSRLLAMNENGNIKVSDTLSRGINNIGVNNGRIFIGSCVELEKFFRDFYLSEYDPQLGLLSDTKFRYFEIPGSLDLITGNVIWHYVTLKFGNIRDHVLRYWYEGMIDNPVDEDQSIKETKAGLYINDQLFLTNSVLDFTEVIRLNNNNLIILFNDNSLYDFINDTTYSWRIDPGKNVHFNKLLRFSDTAFIAAGSINGRPGYIIYNLNGEILDSSLVDCRYGQFNHVSVTPDTNLLLSGYIYTNRRHDRNAYFVKTGSDAIKSYISSMFTGTGIAGVVMDKGEALSPNPTDGEIRVNEDCLATGQLKIEINDIFGRLVNQLFDGYYTGGGLKYDLSSLPDGIYFMNINNNGKVKVLKVIKLR